MSRQSDAEGAAEQQVKLSHAAQFGVEESQGSVGDGKTPPRRLQGNVLRRRGRQRGCAAAVGSGPPRISAVPAQLDI